MVDKAWPLGQQCVRSCALAGDFKMDSFRTHSNVNRTTKNKANGSLSCLVYSHWLSEVCWPRPRHRPHRRVQPLSLSSVSRFQILLKDVDGQVHKLSQYRGKTIVLEWFNPDCPFVKAAHNEETAQKAKLMKNWRGLVSHQFRAPGRQGHGQERNQKPRRVLH